jgi:hypothetical protein
MVSVNARKWGLIVSLTRFVHFGPVPGELMERYLVNVYIDCVFMAATLGPEMLTRPILYPAVSVTAGGISFERPAILEK